MNKVNSAKYAFFYVLSLISLVSVAMAVGTIVFQIINKNVIDILKEFQGTYSSYALRFSIASLIISVPVYYFSASFINKSLFKGELDSDSEIRKWLTYLILLISFMVMSGWLIGTIFNFLDGDITLKFILKALTSLVIAGTIFSYYFYDLKRKKPEGNKDNIIKIYFYASLSLVLVVLFSAFFLVESPKEARLMKIDNQNIERLNNVEMAIQEYFNLNENLPENLQILTESSSIFIRNDYINNIETQKIFDYEILEDKKYQLCTDFNLSNKENSGDNRYAYLSSSWLHDSGYFCFQRAIFDYDSKAPFPVK